MNPIRTLRLARKWTMRDAARQAGISVSNWSDIESGIISNPTVLTASRVAAALGVTIESLFVRTNVTVDTVGE